MDILVGCDFDFDFEVVVEVGCNLVGGYERGRRPSEFSLNMRIFSS